jgi:Na+/proline symporter
MWAVVVTDVLQFIVLTAAVLIVVPLSFGKIGGVSSFIQRVPEHFFSFFNHEYSIGFLIAFAFYNLFYLSGNWAYVQRYTTVKTQRDAKKVGWLFGALYVISPVIWMLPL